MQVGLQSFLQRVLPPNETPSPPRDPQKGSQNEPKCPKMEALGGSILSLFEVIWGALEGHWATLGGVFFGGGEKKSQIVPFWRPKSPKDDQNGSQKEANIVQKMIGKSIEISWLFLSLFFADVGPSLMPKWSQSERKVDATTDMNTKRPQALKS